MSGFMEGEYSASDVERFVSSAVDDERALQGEELEAMRAEIQTAIARAEDAEAELRALEIRSNAAHEQRDAMYVAYPKLEARCKRLADLPERAAKLAERQAVFHAESGDVATAEAFQAFAGMLREMDL